MGIIDNSYCGDNDYWGAKFYATRDGEIEKGNAYVNSELWRISQLYSLVK